MKRALDAGARGCYVDTAIWYDVRSPDAIPMVSRSTDGR